MNTFGIVSPRGGMALPDFSVEGVTDRRKIKVAIALWRHLGYDSLSRKRSQFALVRTMVTVAQRLPIKSTGKFGSFPNGIQNSEYIVCMTTRDYRGGPSNIAVDVHNCRAISNTCPSKSTQRTW
jgi:hypothetical protein